MDYFKILYWICYNITSVLWVLFSSFFWLRGMWGLCSLTRDWTCIPCVGRQSLNHWITREVPSCLFSSLKFPPSPFRLTVCWEAHSVGFPTVWGLLTVPWGAVYRLLFPVLPENGSWSCHWIWSTFGETVSWLGLCVSGRHTWCRWHQQLLLIAIPIHSSGHAKWWHPTVVFPSWLGASLL